MQFNNLKESDLLQLSAFQPEGWRDIIPQLQFYINSSYCFPIKLSEEKTIVAIGTAVVHKQTAWLAHIIVHPDRRKQGLGNAITKYLVDMLHAKKDIETIYLIATELGAPVYEKVGFETESEYICFKESSVDFDQFTLQNIIPYGENYIDQIRELDKLTSGEDRFFRFHDFLKDGSVYFDKNKVEGFYLPGFGEGLIVADNPVAGIELMKLRLKTNDIAILPGENTKAIKFLFDHDFSEFRRVKRMRLGKKRNWLPENLFNRMGGQIG
ncbi:MAG: GNAT family N-acetyltransferase [Chitinophagales bacterium]